MATCGTISDTILELISNERIRLTPGDLLREVRKKCPDQSRRGIRDVIHSLVCQGRLIYTHHFAASQLELNFRQPSQVSERIFLLPADDRQELKPGYVGVKLLDSTTFGGGDHPTTRMMLKAMDTAFAQDRTLDANKKIRALDVGTGSGVLALAALKLGAEAAVGIDIDPLACHAARKNADLNNLAHRFKIGHKLPQNNSGETFDFILINLRPPTMKQLFPNLIPLSAPGARWVLSGFRPEDENGMEILVVDIGFEKIWTITECGWSAWVIKLPDSPHLAMTERL